MTNRMIFEEVSQYERLVRSPNGRLVGRMKPLDCEGLDCWLFLFPIEGDERPYLDYAPSWALREIADKLDELNNKNQEPTNATS